jgi:hypothetical protein
MILLKKKTQYCCLHFQYLYERSMRLKVGSEIQIVYYRCRKPVKAIISYTKSDGKREFKSIKDSDVPVRFFMEASLEYPEDMNLAVHFCPFCGTNLYTFYCKERDFHKYVTHIRGLSVADLILGEIWE